LESSCHPLLFSPHPQVFVLYCRKSETAREKKRQRMEREMEGGRGERNVSSNRTCHLILLKGQQLEIKTKFEINEAHSGGGIRF